MCLNHRTKESIKTALAITIAYGISLHLNWDRSYWAGFAVSFVSLATVGQSFNKATLRIAGTVVAAIMGLTIVALFAQQRWLFILFVSLWLGFCAYMMASDRHQYFWFVSGFVSLIIAIAGGFDAVNSFDVAMIRMQQTGLGVLVYSLVALLIWPNSSRKNLMATTQQLITTQQKLFAASMQLFKGSGDVATLKSLRMDEIATNTKFAVLLDAAVTDSDEVRELKKEWRNYQLISGKLAESMQYWRENVTELQTLPLQQLLPELDAFEQELERRFTAIANMIKQKPPAQPRCTDITLVFDTALEQSSHFQRAALLAAQHHMLQIEALSGKLFDISRAIGGFGHLTNIAVETSDTRGPWVPDPERLLSASKVIILLWLAYLAVIYIDGFPGGLVFVSICGSIGLKLAMLPQVPIFLLYAPTAASVLFASILYILVMPHLHSFAGLGVMIFLATFFICFAFASPKLEVGRIMGLALFGVLLSISNHQHYSFPVLANTVMVFPPLFLLLSIVAYIPYSPRPERAMIRLLSRYFRSADFLLSHSETKNSSDRISWRKAFHQHELASLPSKFSEWTPWAKPAVFGVTSIQQLPALQNSLLSLTYRLQDLQAVQRLPQSPLLIATLDEDIEAWHQLATKVFRHLATDLTDEENIQLSIEMNERLTQLEKRIQIVLDRTDGENSPNPEDLQNFYRLLGAYRGGSKALLDFVEEVANINWVPCYEERFA